MAKRRWVAQGCIIVRMKDANGNWGFHTAQKPAETDQKPRTCKTAPVCEEFKLHNFRKTYATKPHHHGTSLNDLKTWLGHKDLKTTQLYLAGSESHAPHVRAAVDAAFSF
jgi:integrase